jgi:D-3-phosphoglycerate dehydrogenase
MKKVLIATEKPFAPVAVEGIREIVKAAGYELILLEKYTDPAELKAAVADVDAMIIRSDKATREVLEAAKNLKVIVRAGAGYDNIDLTAATELGIVAMNTPGQNSNAVAELALGMMVFLARGGFNGKAGTELKGKVLGIHAYGNVGRLIAKIALGFGMEVMAFDPFVDAKQIEADGVKAVGSVEELYASCQYVSLNIPANDKTKNSIGKDLLSSMPKGACLVNTARKEVINEDELLEVMEAREDLKYISDIAPVNAPVIEAKFPGRFFFTPKKMGAQTAEANINAGKAAASQIREFLENGDITFKVN